MAKQLFGTDGIRGVPGEYPLDDATLDRVGLALGEYLNSNGTAANALHGAKPRVLIGRDTRESGPHIAERIARGLAGAGAEPVSAGVLTTPGVAWLVNREGFAAGVVISASHNPYHDNGVKLISSIGHEISRCRGGDPGRYDSRSRARLSMPRAGCSFTTTNKLTTIISRDCAKLHCPAQNSRE